MLACPKNYFVCVWVFEKMNKMMRTHHADLSMTMMFRLRLLVAFLCAAILLFLHLLSTLFSMMWPGSNAPIVYPPLDGDFFQQQQASSAAFSFLDTVERRVSTRSFQNTPVVSDHDIHNALRTARLAPSAGNLQAYQVVVVRDEQQKSRIAAAALHQEWIAKCTCCIGVFGRLI